MKKFICAFLAALIWTVPVKAQEAPLPQYAQWLLSSDLSQCKNRKKPDKDFHQQWLAMFDRIETASLRGDNGTPVPPPDLSPLLAAADDGCQERAVTMVLQIKWLLEQDPEVAMLPLLDRLRVVVSQYFSAEMMLDWHKNQIGMLVDKKRNKELGDYYTIDRVKELDLPSKTIMLVAEASFRHSQCYDCTGDYYRYALEKRLAKDGFVPTNWCYRVAVLDFSDGKSRPYSAAQKIIDANFNCAEYLEHLVEGNTDMRQNVSALVNIIRQKRPAPQLSYSGDLMKMVFPTYELNIGDYRKSKRSSHYGGMPPASRYSCARIGFYLKPDGKMAKSYLLDRTKQDKFAYTIAKRILKSMANELPEDQVYPLLYRVLTIRLEATESLDGKDIKPCRDIDLTYSGSYSTRRL